MKYTKDIKRYTDYSGKSALLMLLTQQGLWALMVYRFHNYIHRSKLPAIRPIALGIGVLHQRFMEIITTRLAGPIYFDLKKWFSATDGISGASRIQIHQSVQSGNGIKLLFYK